MWIAEPQVNLHLHNQIKLLSSECQYILQNPLNLTSSVDSDFAW